MPRHSHADRTPFLIKCNLEGRTYRVLGYKGKQVRDNIHIYDVVQFMRWLIEAARQARSTTWAAAAPTWSRSSMPSR